MLTEDERNDLLDDARDVVLLATTFTGLHRELSNAEWDEFVEQVGREVSELILRRVRERMDEVEAKAGSEVR